MKKKDIMMEYRRKQKRKLVSEYLNLTKGGKSTATDAKYKALARLAGYMYAEKHTNEENWVKYGTVFEHWFSIGYYDWYNHPYQNMKSYCSVWMSRNQMQEYIYGFLAYYRVQWMGDGEELDFLIEQ